MTCIGVDKVAHRSEYLMNFKSRLRFIEREIMWWYDCILVGDDVGCEVNVDGSNGKEET